MLRSFNPMGTTIVDIKYKPLKIAFLVRSSSLEDLYKAVGMNTLIAGGELNPIISVSEKGADFIEILESFSVDAICMVHKDIENYIAVKEQLFIYQKVDIYTPPIGRNRFVMINVIDILNEISIVYQNFFNGKDKPARSDFQNVEWDVNDPLAKLFAVCYGYFPNEKFFYQYENAYKDYLQANITSIGLKETLPAEILTRISPIQFSHLGFTLTNRLLDISIIPEKDLPSLYFGKSQNFDDLVIYWNLRAWGFNIEFIPLDAFERYEKIFEAWIKEIRMLGREKEFKVYYLRENGTDVDGYLRVKELFSLNPLFIPLNGLNINRNAFNIMPTQVYYDRSEERLANIDYDEDFRRYNVSVSLLEKPIEKDFQRFERQQFIASIQIKSEQFYRNHTIRLPFALNKLGIKDVLDHDIYAFKEGGLNVFITNKSDSIVFHPVPYSTIVDRLFKTLGLIRNYSQPGLITKRILENMKYLHAANIFELEGVRNLLQAPNLNSTVTLEEAQTIINNGQKSIKYPPRVSTKKRAKEVFNELVKRDYLRPGIRLICRDCNIENWLSINQISEIWQCDYCGHRNEITDDIKNQAIIKWAYRRNGLFARNDRQQGAISVLLAMYKIQQACQGYRSIIAEPSLEIQNLLPDRPIEIDCLMLLYDGKTNRVEMVIGECKSRNGKIDKGDLDHLAQLWERFEKMGIKAYILLSKTSKAFTTEEVKEFKKLATRHIPLICLLQTDLESDSLLDGIKGFPPSDNNPLDIISAALMAKYL